MSRSGFYSVLSVVMGLPSETAADVSATQKMVDRVLQERAVVFPIFYEPVQQGEITAGTGFGLSQMTPEHLHLLRTCYEANFKRIPRLYWDNQRAGGVGYLKRAMLQVLGKGEVMLWRRKFRRLGKQLRAKTSQE